MGDWEPLLSLTLLNKSGKAHKFCGEIGMAQKDKKRPKSQEQEK